MQINHHLPLKQLLAVCLRASQQASRAILAVYNSAFDVEYKQDESPLTLADKRSHEILEKELEYSFPDIPILSEEGKDIPYKERKNWEYFWLVDPLDGTKEFVKKNGEFTVNIALICKNRPIMGIIYVPVYDDVYFSMEGAGSFKLKSGSRILNDLFKNTYSVNDTVVFYNELISNSVKLPVNKIIKNDVNSELNVIISRSHMTDETEEFLNQLQKLYKKIVKISLGSSLKLCAIAEGKADVYPRFAPTMEWDTAAGHAIIEQVGGYLLQKETNKSLIYNKKSLVNPWFIAAGDLKYIP